MTVRGVTRVRCDLATKQQQQQLAQLDMWIRRIDQWDRIESPEKPTYLLLVDL